MPLAKVARLFLSHAICCLLPIFAVVMPFLVNMFIDKFLYSYGYDSVDALVESVFPSTKYVGFGQSAALSSVLGCICSALGVWPVLVIAMMLIMLIELVSGVCASHKRKEHFESSKFSRFLLKLCIWFVLFLSCQVFAFFASHYDEHSLAWLVGAWFFDVLTVILMIAFVVENATSILENLACIDNHDKSYYIEAVKHAASVAFNKLTGNK